MFEKQTYENLLTNSLARVSSSLDKREGSMVMNGVAPSMAELAQLYIALDFILTAMSIHTMPREFLIKRAKERNMPPEEASAAVFRAEFNTDVPIGTRFSCEDLNFVVVEKMNDIADSISYKLECETPGTAANGYIGRLIPIDYINGLTYAELVELITPGDDEEDTEVLRQRLLDSYQSQAFGGNRADYIEKVTAIKGVGAVKVYPVWNGDISPSSLIPSETVRAWYEGIITTLDEDTAKWLSAVFTAADNKLLTVGGTVKLVVMASGNTVPSDAFISEIQTVVDPEQNAGEGLGLAPMGHVVNVCGVISESVDITLNLTYAEGWDFSSAQSYIEKVIEDYFAELATEWAKSTHLVVRISQIESRILAACSTIITDISGTKINGIESNLALSADSIPVRGEIDG
ncbi:MAG: baseplate J/gp47 family protein [Clostridia bacterium]|nr:baseplate J/gp47 family protein [Clostridia bacterium]